MERADAEAVLAHALERGITFLDDARYDDETGDAPMRSGWSEVLFGELFRAVGADRDAVVVSNKLWWEFWPRRTRWPSSRVAGRMGFERIDLLYSSTLPDSVIGRDLRRADRARARHRARSGRGRSSTGAPSISRPP